MLVSLERVAIGFAVGGAAVLVLGVVSGLSRLGENSVDTRWHADAPGADSLSA